MKGFLNQLSNTHACIEFSDLMGRPLKTSKTHHKTYETLRLRPRDDCLLCLRSEKKQPHIDQETKRDPRNAGPLREELS